MHMRSFLTQSVSVLSLLATTSFAQDQGVPFDLGEIVLSGELLDRDLFNSPTSVAVESGEDLERRGDPSLYNFVERTPNVESSGGQKGFRIRGIDQRGSGGGGAGKLVSTQVDGVALPSTIGIPSCCAR